MKIFTHGVIDCSKSLENFGIEPLIVPSIFMGIILPPSSTFSAMNFNHTPAAVNAANAFIGLHLFKNGQFVYEHQYMGHQCLTAVLVGIFMPLNTCNEPGLRERLTEVTRRFHPEEGRLRRPAAREHWSGVLRELALPQELQAADLDEALIRFNAHHAYSLLRRSFKYAVAFSGLGNDDLRPKIDNILSIVSFDLNDASSLRWAPSRNEDDVARLEEVRRQSAASRAISRLDDLPWDSVHAFAQWLSRGKEYPVKDSDVSVALVYANSD